MHFDIKQKSFIFYWIRIVSFRRLLIFILVWKCLQIICWKSFGTFTFSVTFLFVVKSHDKIWYLMLSFSYHIVLSLIHFKLSFWYFQYLISNYASNFWILLIDSFYKFLDICKKWPIFISNYCSVAPHWNYSKIEKNTIQLIGSTYLLWLAIK